MARLQRYEMLKNLDDLEQSILRFTEAIFIPPPWYKSFLNITQTFSQLAGALLCRADEFRQPEDVTRSIIYLRYLRGQPLESFDVSPSGVTGLLVRALRIQVDMKLGDERQDTEEMAVLCHELLKSDMSTTDLNGCIMNLLRAVDAQSGRLYERQEHSDRVIGCLREAIIRKLDCHEQVSLTLTWCLFYRFRATHSNDDYEEGMTILENVIPTPEDRSKRRLREIVLTFFAFFARERSEMFGKPEYLEEAIYRTRASRAESSYLDSLFQADGMGALAPLEERRFNDPSIARSLQEAQLRNSQNTDHPSFRDLTTSLSLTGLNNDNQFEHLDAIHFAFSDHITDGAELEEVIKYYRLLLASSHRGSVLSHKAGTALGVLLHRAFSCTNKIDYLNGAISVLWDNFNNRDEQNNQFPVIRHLISSLFSRFCLLQLEEDLNEIMELFRIAANYERVTTPERFSHSTFWANIARVAGHPSTSAAYDTVMSLMQDTLTFAPTLDIQHSRVVAMRDRYENLPLDHASYRVSIGQLPRAIETLERGRALIWSEMRGLRASTDQIRAIDSYLADKFVTVNRDLETITLTISADSNDDGQHDGTLRMDRFGRQQRKLLNDRNKLISRIQALPGFETFLKSPSFDNLRSAAARGPVIIINHSEWRSDILILVHNSPPSLISTADDFYHRANNMRDKLLGARKESLDSNEYEDALSFVLEELYNLVGQPVIQKLNELSVPGQSRVWWCPTSVFCSLPLHAMGPIPSNEGPLRYFLDLYIPSYTSTLSTLIESNNPGSDTLDKPSILLVSLPDASLPGALGEMRVVQAGSFQVATLSSASATPTAVLEHLRDHKFVHIICHGILEPGKPFDTSFQLYGGERLSLLNIVRSQLPEAEFAFLSACHTAELTEESIADEGLHLTAAMQYCGFRSVVGTMWEMLDADGRDLAEIFYKGVFSGKKQGVRYYERTAEALRDAVKILRRKKRMTLERWVNFVHYGA